MSGEESGAEWANEPEVPKKKKGLPGWLWFCGGGCLIVVVLAAIGAIFAVKQFEGFTDQTVQWEKLSASVEIDVPPEGWSFHKMPMVPFDQFIFTGAGGSTFTLMIMEPPGAAEMEEIFSEDFDGGAVMGLQEVKDIEHGSILVQGRELRVVHFIQKVVMQGESDGAYIDITPEDSEDFWLLVAATPAKLDAITDDYIRDFLLPFHIGPDHVTQVAAPDAFPEIEAEIEEPPVEVIEESVEDEEQ